MLWHLGENQPVNKNGIKRGTLSRGANGIPHITGCWFGIVSSDLFRTCGAWIIFCELASCIFCKIAGFFQEPVGLLRACAPSKKYPTPKNRAMIITGMRNCQKNSISRANTTVGIEMTVFSFLVTTKVVSLIKRMNLIVLPPYSRERTNKGKSLKRFSCPLCGRPKVYAAKDQHVLCGYCHIPLAYMPTDKA